ncbi:hypothetical protein [Cupriavidus metallidurans]|uniref:hypothetical protein n=1 Tax=Cupriavidus metallidurans TaxID=119219 RepID=UPI001CCD115E|nr:hypothetical protein [Cupriavidus metallidurans]UBM12704.1 hypothetical protein LAI70_28230 [Cupriavidus metallidurans]
MKITYLLAIGVVAGIAALAVADNEENRGLRAYEAAETYVSSTGLRVVSLSCLPMTDSDGMAPCVAVTQMRKVIALACPARLWATPKSCEPVEGHELYTKL